MIDPTLVIHYAFTGISFATATFLAWSKIKDNRAAKSQMDDSVCENDRYETKVKLAVIEERLNNQIDLLNRLDDKLEDIRREL